MLDPKDEIRMLPDSAEQGRSRSGRRWARDLFFIAGAAIVAWIAIDQISDEERVLAKFSPPPVPRVNLEGSKEQKEEVASLNRTASAAGDALTTTSGTVAAPAPTAAAVPPSAAPSVVVSAAPVVAPVAVAPVAVAKAPREPSPSVVSTDAVSKAFEEWLRLWQARDAQAYIGLYAATRQDLKGHLRVRSQRIQKAKFIEVGASNVSIRQTGPSEVTVRFQQSYRSDTHTSKDMKELVWSVASQQPKIIAERLVN